VKAQLMLDFEDLLLSERECGTVGYLHVLKYAEAGRASHSSESQEAALAGKIQRVCSSVTNQNRHIGQLKQSLHHMQVNQNDCSGKI